MLMELKVWLIVWQLLLILHIENNIYQVMVALLIMLLWENTRMKQLFTIQEAVWPPF